MDPNLDDMRIFAKVADAGSFTGAARLLAMPKQTVSRRFAALERTLGVQLAHRTTRSLRLTDVGTAYAQRCREVVRLAEDATLAVSSTSEVPRGTLRITADPTFGEAFVPELVAKYLETYAGVEVEVVLTQRRVDLVEEGFDLAFRVGRLENSSLIATRLGPARLGFAAAPAYLEREGIPADPGDLSEHSCIVLAPGNAPVRWPIRGPDGGITAVPIRGRIRVNSLPMARRVAAAGLGIVNLPAFAMAEDVRSGVLVPVLEQHVADVGGVYVVYPQHRFLAPRVRRFVDLAVEQLRSSVTWEVE